MKKVLILSFVALTACNSSSSDNDSSPVDNDTQAASNPAPYIPAQCYTNPVEASGKITNPCYTCHTNSIKPNYLNDNDVQLAYSFPESILENHWKNYFKDHSSQIAKITDEAILAYIKQDNYTGNHGQYLLADYLEKNYAQYDTNQNGRWDGYMPDIAYNFDNEGFDLDKNGNPTGWRAFAYYPFPGSFMPTNGSTDDVIIRLSKPFRTDESGNLNRDVYKTNLAIVEALIKKQDIYIDETDEQALGVDLNKDGTLSTASLIRYDWAPLEGRLMSYVGQARLLQAQGKVHLAAGLYPEGTEFIHSVRYININDQQKITLAPRMKELRYAKKTNWVTYYQLEESVAAEIKERHDFPDRIKQTIGTVEEGVSVPQGWVYQGFIENKQGDLRPQTLPEQVFCSGCHSGTGVIADTTFAFQRKLDANNFQQGWYHWTQKGLDGLPEPKRKSDGKYEYSFYLTHNPTGDEYRSNTEVQNKFYHSDGTPKTEAFEALHENIAELLIPTTARALQLNKAYKVLVEEQSFEEGREALLVGENVVYQKVELDQPTGIQEATDFF